MILSDRDIKREIKEGGIFIAPFNEACVQPASIDLHLGRHFLVFNTSENFVIDVKEPTDNLMRELSIDGDTPFILHPKEFALGMIAEEIGVSNKIVGRLEGKSSLGRLGLVIHTTAGYLDPGNRLKMTLELFNAGTLPIKLYTNMPIGQMAFEYLASPCEKPYGTDSLHSKYYHDDKPVASKMYLNFQKTEVIATKTIMHAEQTTLAAVATDAFDITHARGFGKYHAKNQASASGGMLFADIK